MARARREWIEGSVYHVFARGQFLTTIRYVVRNPVDAGVYASPFDARWTSFPATIGLAPAPEYLRVGEILEHFSHDPIRAREQFIKFVVGEPEGASAAPPVGPAEELGAAIVA